MARQESIASGGYFPTPQHLVPLICKYLQPVKEGWHSVTAVDPCAGEGAAIIDICAHLEAKVDLWSCELEKGRHEVLVESVKKYLTYGATQTALHGDAFQVEFLPKSAGLLYLNPPYDTDPVHGRLEQRFLNRFAPILSPDEGVLVLLVPHYALKASAEILAREFDDLLCMRFPGKDFDTFKQVCLIAKKTSPRFVPDSRILAQVQSWAADASGLSELGVPDGDYFPDQSYVYNARWKMRKIDLVGLLRSARPWQQTSRFGATVQTPHILPETPVKDLMFRSFPVATAPRPAHTASGIASGMFNGRRVSARRAGLPDLLVKGSFDREFVTIEEKQDKTGMTTSVVQVQQPKLVTTVLDLSSRKYHTLALGKTGSRNVAEFGIEDLLEHYGQSLLEVMQEQCPVTYDPKRDGDSQVLAPVSRKLFQAQEHASKAILSLLGGPNCKDRRYKAAILLGEIGSGKSLVALTVGKTIGSRMLTLCPPHLLQSWTDEIKLAFPEAEVRVLQDIFDVEALKDVPKDKFLVAILSRETAKLSHGMESVSRACPKCGAPVPAGDLAKRRACCDHRPLSLRDPFAQAAHSLALKLAPYDPEDSQIGALLEGRHLQRWLKTLEDRDEPKWKPLPASWLNPVIDFALEQAMERHEGYSKLLALLLLANYRPDKILEIARHIAGNLEWGRYELVRSLGSLLPRDSAGRDEVLATIRQSNTYAYGWGGSSIHEDEEGDIYTSFGYVRWINGAPALDKKPANSYQVANELFKTLCKFGTFTRGEECGEPLYQAVPKPRRYALAKYIARKLPNFFDFLVLDEAHEYSSEGSAQGISAHRLTELGIPTLLMTGSIMNGYAESLFTNMWAISREFRREFDRDEKQQFIDRYGYRKRILSEKDRLTGEILEFGSQTDRVERQARKGGDAPGILPLFLFRHLLKHSVTLHKADLALELPECRQIKCEVDADSELLESFKQLKQTLLARIRKDMYDKEGKSGKLFGALAELPSYLDRATEDTGNQEDGSYVIRYPESVGGEEVARGKSLPASQTLAKEEWMLDLVERELAEGRNVMVYCWHVSLLPRLARLVEKRIGQKVPILYANKVATGKRQDWIDKQVVKKDRRVLVTNPVAIQTGLNNLVHFASEIWMENPACNPTIFRQAIGRIDRIGQPLETRVYFPIYRGTLQETLHELLLRKVAVATATDGLDNESVLLAAGASTEGYLTGLSIGRQLWNMLQEEC